MVPVGPVGPVPPPPAEDGPVCFTTSRCRRRPEWHPAAANGERDRWLRSQWRAGPPRAPPIRGGGGAAGGRGPRGGCGTAPPAAWGAAAARVRWGVGFDVCVRRVPARTHPARSAWVGICRATRACPEVSSLCRGCLRKNFLYRLAFRKKNVPPKREESMRQSHRRHFCSCAFISEKPVKPKA